MAVMVSAGLWTVSNITRMLRCVERRGPAHKPGAYPEEDWHLLITDVLERAGAGRGS